MLQYANPFMARKHAMHHQTKGNIEKRILNTRAINATAVEENRGIHWKAVQHLATNVMYRSNRSFNMPPPGNPPGI